MPAEDFDRLVDTHYGGAVRVSRAAWPHLKRSGAGRIVNMSSASVFGTPFTSPYVSSKAGIFGLDACARGRGRVLRDRRERGDAGGVHPHDRAAARRRRLPHVPRDVLPAREGGAVRGVPRPRDCAINGETFSVGADRAARVFLAECPGVVGDGTPEGYAAHADELLSVEGWEIPSDMMDEVRYSSDHLGPEIAGRVRARRRPPRSMSDFDAVLWDYGGIFTASPFACRARVRARPGRRAGRAGAGGVRQLRGRHRPRVAPARAG